ncbi:MAG: SEL1-like repeat protein [Bacteroides sp.]|nr:SEL1-like repeat protein [Bacteroides sp.]
MMKRLHFRHSLLLAGLVMLLLPAQGMAQDEQCYQSTRSDAMKEFLAKRFRNAKGLLQTAMYCPDKPERNDLEFWLKRCDQALNTASGSEVEAFADRMSLYDDYSNDGFVEGMMAVTLKADAPHFDSMPEGSDPRDYAPKVGFVDENGHLAVPCIYEDVTLYSMRFGYYFSNGLAAVIKRSDDGTTCGWGYIDKRGNEVIPFQYADTQPFSEGIAAVQEYYGAYWSFIDKQNRQALPVSVYWAGAFSEGLCAVVPDSTSNGYGFMDRSGRMVIPARYSEVRGFKNGTAAVFSPGHGYEAALIDRQGRLVGDYTFRPEFLSLSDIDIYAVDMFNAGNYDKCLMAIRGYERRCEEREIEVRAPSILPYMEGRIYFKGYGSQAQDYAKAFAAFKRGQESNALYMLGICYYNGYGVAQDYAKALQCYEQALQRNNWDGHGYVSYPSWENKGVLSARFSETSARFALGLIYYYGKGTAVDYKKALDHFKAAQDGGKEEAKEFVARCVEQVYGR